MNCFNLRRTIIAWCAGRAAPAPATVWRINRVGVATACLLAAAVHAETAYFVMSGPAFGFSQMEPQAYVVTVTDPALIQQARDYLRAGDRSVNLVPHVKIAAGFDGVNFNYADPRRLGWNWRVTELREWITFDPSLPRATVVIPNVDGRPSDVPQLLEGTPTYPSVDTMQLVNYPLVMELTPGVAGQVVNVSTRGWVGEGERVLITGFIVQGGEPRNVVVRALGPSLAAFGVTDVLTDPKIVVYRSDGTRIAQNDNWGDGNFVPQAQIPEDPPQWPPSLSLHDPKEAAVWLSLPPGAYTVHVSGADGGTGVALADVHDLDALRPE